MSLFLSWYLYLYLSLSLLLLGGYSELYPKIDQDALMNRSKKFARKCAKRLDGSSEPSTTDKVGSSDTCGTHSSSLISTIAASCGRQARVEIFRNWRSF